MKYFINVENNPLSEKPINADNFVDEEINEYLKKGYLLSSETFAITIDDAIYSISETGEWVSSFIDFFEEARQAKLDELKINRDFLETEPVEYKGKFFDFDEVSRERIRNAIITLQLLGPDSSYEWTCADDTSITVTEKDLSNVILIAGTRSNKLHMYYRELKQLVENASTEEELNNIIWNFKENE